MTEIPERKVEKESEEILEIIMADDFSKLVTSTKPQIQDSQRLPRRKHTKKSTPSYIIFKIQITEKQGWGRERERSFERARGK